jgi:diguanylate cyclase (GGDEF)-like protein
MGADDRSPSERTTEAIGPRIAGLLETVQAFAELDFSHRAIVGPEGNDLDALAAGINMLGEEAEAARRDLQASVAERTEELANLAELTGDLEQEIVERRKAEVALRDANEGLSRSVNELERLNREIVQLTEMSNLLQVCGTREEAFTVLAHVGQDLFAQTAGSVFVYVPSRDVLESVAGWGGSAPDSRTITPGDCWALRRGRMHRSGGVGLSCEHLEDAVSEESLCIPLIAQGETLGLLNLRWGHVSDASDPRRLEEGKGLERLAVASSEQIALALANVELKAALQAQSIRDPLTGLYNRRFLDETLARELRRSARDGSSVSFLMLDVDGFKVFNDRYGHDVGDVVLRQVAVHLRDAVRAEDVVCRYGGEEFAVVMSGADGMQAAARAEEVRATVAGTEFDWHGQPTGRLTVSIGIASYPANAESRGGLVHAADRALYEAKSAGRDRIAVSRATAAEGLVPDQAG